MNRERRESISTDGIFLPAFKPPCSNSRSLFFLSHRSSSPNVHKNIFILLMSPQPSSFNQGESSSSVRGIKPITIWFELIWSKCFSPHQMFRKNKDRSAWKPFRSNSTVTWCMWKTKFLWFPNDLGRWTFGFYRHSLPWLIATDEEEFFVWPNIKALSFVTRKTFTLLMWLNWLFLSFKSKLQEMWSIYFGVPPIISICRLQ